MKLNSIKFASAICLIAALLFGETVFAQSVANSKTLSDVLKYALEENTDIKKQNLAILQSKYRRQEAISQGLPQINGSVQLVDNLQIQQQLLPGEIFGGAPGSFIPVKFGTQYSIPIALKLEQLIYSQSYINAIKTTSAAKNLSQVQAEKVKQDIIYNSSVAFYQAIIASEQLNVIEANLKKLEQSVVVAQVQYDNKMSRKIDLDQLKVNLANTQADYTNAAISYAQSIDYLKVLIGFPLGDSLSLIQEAESSDLTLPENTTASSPLMKLYDGQLKLKELEIKGINSGYAPTLAGFAQYGYQSQGNGFGKGELRSFGSAAIGLSLNVPIFDGLRKLRQAQQKKVELNSLQLEQKYTQTQLNFQYQNSVNKYLQSQKTVNNQKNTYELAKSVYDAVQVNYNNGLASLSDLINADSGMKSAQTLYLTALLQQKVSALDVMKANGNLNSLTK
jgi:outer membrane protein